MKRFDASSILERSAAALKNKTEEELASSFNGFTPENMLKLVRLSMPYSGVDWEHDSEENLRKAVFGDDGKEKAELDEKTIEIIIDRFPTFFDKKEVEEVEDNRNKVKGGNTGLRHKIFTEFPMETVKDSIYYIKPLKTKKN
jgi:hypothetical protein